MFLPLQIKSEYYQDKVAIMIFVVFLPGQVYIG